MASFDLPEAVLSKLFELLASFANEAKIELQKAIVDQEGTNFAVVVSRINELHVEAVKPRRDIDRIIGV